MSVKRTHIVIPNDVAAEIDRIVGKRGRSLFLVEAARRELLRLRQIKALEAATGSWKDADHPELKSGTWTRRLRATWDRPAKKRR